MYCDVMLVWCGERACGRGMAESRAGRAGPRLVKQLTIREPGCRALGWSSSAVIDWLLRQYGGVALWRWKLGRKRVRGREMTEPSVGKIGSGSVK